MKGSVLWSTKHSHELISASNRIWTQDLMIQYQEHYLLGNADASLFWQKKYFKMLFANT